MRCIVYELECVLAFVSVCTYSSGCSDRCSGGGVLVYGASHTPPRVHSCLAVTVIYGVRPFDPP